MYERQHFKMPFTAAHRLETKTFAHPCKCGLMMAFPFYVVRIYQYVDGGTDQDSGLDGKRLPRAKLRFPASKTPLRAP
jgi:hypothetical protein